MNIITIDGYIKNPLQLELANSFQKSDNVEKIDILQKGDIYQVEAIVNVLSQQILCQFQLDQDGKLSSHECHCGWSQPKNPCGHIGAVLLKMQELDIKTIPFHYTHFKSQQIKERVQKYERRRYLARLREQTKVSQDLISQQKEVYHTHISSLLQTEKYSLEPNISKKSDYYWVDYKVGLQKMYVIKNLYKFLENIQEQKNIKYGKQLEFVHNKEAFDEFSVKQIEFIQAADESWITQTQEDYYYPSHIDRHIPLVKDILDLFFDTYEDYENDIFVLEYVDEKIKFSLKEENDIYVLSIVHMDDYVFGKKYLYKINENNQKYIIQRLMSDSHGILVNLVERLLQEETIAIMKEDYPEFEKYVLSSLYDHIDISSSVSLIQNHYDTIHLYGDVNDEGEVFVKLEYINQKGHIQKGFDSSFITNYQQDLVETYISKFADIDKNANCAYFHDDEKTYEFIQDGLSFLQDYCDIFVSEALKRMGETKTYKLSVGVRCESDLLSIDIDSEEIPKKEIAHVLDYYRRKKKFYRLKSGKLISLASPDLQEMTQFMDEFHLSTKDIEDGHVTLNKNRMFALDQMASSSQYLQVEREESFQNILDHFMNVNPQEHILDEPYSHILRDYQKEGYFWLRTLRDYGFNGILADDMGLGKTLQVIALLDNIESQYPSLVVCPTSLIYNWENEVYKFTENLKVKCIVGNQAERKKAIASYQDYDLLVTSYDYMRRDVEFYEDLQFEYVILDEAQYIKNQKTMNARSVKKLKANHKLALTGTPIENSLAELWSIFDFLMPQYLYNYHYFLKNYEKDIVKKQDQEKTKKLRQLVSPFILRRKKTEVLKELPDKIEKTYYIQFNEEEHKLYLANLVKVNEDLQKLLEMEHVDKVQVLAMLTRLRQICCEPRLVYEGIDTASSKMTACLDLIMNLQSNQQKVLLFSTFTSLLDLIAQELSYRNISYYILTGQTSKEERASLVDQFQNDDTTVFLISLKAGGTGLNLTAAQAVIHFDPWWNISAQNQATDRAYRIGQENKVQVFQLVMKDSIEEKIINLQNRKKELADTFVEGHSGGIASMDKDDIMNLFKM